MNERMVLVFNGTAYPVTMRGIGTVFPFEPRMVPLTLRVQQEVASGRLQIFPEYLEDPAPAPDPAPEPGPLPDEPMRPELESKEPAPAPEDPPATRARKTKE